MCSTRASIPVVKNEVFMRAVKLFPLFRSDKAKHTDLSTTPKETDILSHMLHFTPKEGRIKELACTVI